MSDHYILDGRTPVPTDMMTWAKWFETADRTVSKTQIGEWEVSTVFLGLDHAFGDGPPLLFETLVFGGPLDSNMVRYSTWDQAEAGHAEMVNRVKAALT
jgi:hypothetical protein